MAVEHLAGVPVTPIGRLTVTVVAMRDADSPVCWAPECGNVPPPSKGSRPSRYCSGRCRVRAVRRNGGKAPHTPYPPYEPMLTPVPAPAPVRARKADNVPSASAPPVAQEQPRRRRTVKTPPKEAGPPPELSASADGVPVDRPGAPEAPPAAPAARVTQLHVAVTEDATLPVEIRVHPLVAQYRADLEAIGMAATRQGLQVIEMAEKLVSAATSPAAASGLSRELDRMMADLEQNTPSALAERDPSLVIRERTLAKLRAVQAAPGAAERAG